MIMKAKAEFKKKADLALELDNLGVEYKKVESGANKGKATQSVDELYELYVIAMNGNVNTKPKFRKAPRKFNSMTFRF